MHCVAIEIIVFLVLTALHVHCRVVSKSQNRNETNFLLSLKTDEMNGPCSPNPCKNDGICSVDGKKFRCTCPTPFTGSWCEIECDCGLRGRCTVEYGEKKCTCDPFTSERDGICVDCYCGENSKSCHFDWRDKVCNCSSGYAQMQGFCFECECGIHAQSCSIRRNGTKECNCYYGYTETNGTCSAVCSEEKCLHGKCEIVGYDGFKCRCDEGFSGKRCEDKIQTKSNKMDFWKIMLLAITFSIFLLLSAILCFLGRIQNKISKK